ncbi:MAG: thiamine pyrophosphate-dependent enzyme [Bacteroidota bacterium]|nr:thiamine pyrophosphate-dependent enzyme [Bacteroidota bacterium]
MKRMMLLGDEAIAQGALDAGLSGAYAYPGTPSTEITEYVQRSPEAKARGVYAQWSANEKTAMETALGMSYAGKRAIACMKHVGLNVAADGFINSAITGANGGLIVVAADDPSMHSSQNEQDSRFYGKFAMVPTIEPGNQQEAYDAMHYGFDLSEKYGTPVLVRITTRLAHSRSAVTTREPRMQNDLRLPENKRQFVLLPAIARKNYQSLLGKQEAFEKESSESAFNRLIDGPDRSTGIVAAGLAFNYLMEIFPDGCPHPVLKVGQYPLPRVLVKRLFDACPRIIVLEEGAPFVEEMLRGVLDGYKDIHGRMDGLLPRAGELNPNIVGQALGKEIRRGESITDVVVSRPPELCKGCPHIDTFEALNEALRGYEEGRVFSDIGCYTLGALPPFNAINSCVDMGASITMAIGAAEAGLVPSIAVIGDSTFTHSGITGLLDAVNAAVPITVVILDNDTTAMTGGQPSPGSGKLTDICLGVGVPSEHIIVIEPLKKNHAANVEVMKREIQHPGVSVIIPRRECIQTAADSRKEAKKS